MEEKVLEQSRKKRKMGKNNDALAPSSIFAPKRVRRNAITEQHLSLQELLYLQKLSALPSNTT